MGPRDPDVGREGRRCPGNHILTGLPPIREARYVLGDTHHALNQHALQTVPAPRSANALCIAPFGGATTQNAVADVWLEPQDIHITPSAGPNGSLSPSQKTQRSIAGSPARPEPASFTINPRRPLHFRCASWDGARAGGQRTTTKLPFTGVTWTTTKRAIFGDRYPTLRVRSWGSGKRRSAPALNVYELRLQTVPTDGHARPGGLR